MIPVSRVSRLVNRLFATLMMALLASSSFAQQTNPFPTSTPERLKKTAAAYRARAELVPPEVRATYVAWADYYDSMAALEPGAPVPVAPKILPGATAPAQALAEGSAERKPGISTLEALSIAIDVTRNPGSFAQGALDAWGAKLDQVIAESNARLNEWKQAQTELRQHSKEIAAWCVAHADPAAHAYIDAARTGDLDTVRRWIEDGNDPNACDELGNTALAVAASPSERNTAQLPTDGAFPGKGAAPNLDQPIDKLVDAALHGDSDAKNQLEHICLRPLDTTEGVARLEEIFLTILHAALVDNNKHALSLIQDMRRVLKERNKTPLECPLPSLPSHVLVTRYLLLHGADLMARTTALNTPLDTSDLWSARLLIDARAPIDAGGSEYSALKQAIIAGNTQLVLRLIASGAHPVLSDSFVTDDIQARTSGYWDLARLLLHFKKRDARVAEALGKLTRPGTGAIPLNFAASSGSVELVQRYLDSGVNADACDDCSWTPLMNAAQADNVDVMKLLLDKGASINAVNAFGQTALMLAIRTASVKAASLLLERGADPKLKDISGMGAREWLNARTERDSLFAVRFFSADEARALGDQLKQAESGRKGR